MQSDTITMHRWRWARILRYESIDQEMEVGGGYSVEGVRMKYKEREPGDGVCMKWR